MSAEVLLLNVASYEYAKIAYFANMPDRCQEVNVFTVRFQCFLCCFQVAKAAQQKQDECALELQCSVNA